MLFYYHVPSPVKIILPVLFSGIYGKDLYKASVYWSTPCSKKENRVIAAPV